jgi:hypothetical protein
VPWLLKRAEDRKEHEAVRQEAVIALRLAAGAVTPKIAEALVTLAEKGPLAVARVALLSLKEAKLAPAHERRLGKLCGHEQAERALLAIDLLGQRGGDAAAEALGRTLLETGERARAEAAANAIGKRPDAAAALARVLFEARERDRVELLARLLRPHVGQLDKKAGQRLVAEAMGRLEEEDAGADGILAVARAFDAGATNEKLRDLRDRLRKKQKWARALQIARLVGRSRDAVPEDGYTLGALELGHGLKDEALVVMNQLLDRGFDVGGAMRKDRSLTDQHRYDVGFHFIERGHPLGEELLSAVSASAGRSKLGQMARAKLKSSGYGE